MELTFAKYTACGNDFIIIDKRVQQVPPLSKAEISKLCERRFGIGSDGLIFIDESFSADAKMIYHNSDGGEANLCGNGVRCVARHLQREGFKKETLHLETKFSILEIAFPEERIRVFQEMPKKVKWQLSLETPPLGRVLYDFLDTGVPHIVIFVSDCELIDLNLFGSTLCHHPNFLPEGTNVNIASRKEGLIIKMRTFERGVEEETLACGTGAIAVGLAAARHFSFKDTIILETKSKETLLLTLPNHSKFLSLEGPASFVFNGKLKF